MSINGSLAVVSPQQSEHSCVVMSPLIYPRIVCFSLFLFPFFLCCQHSFNFWFSFYCFLSHSAISFLIISSALSFLVPLSLGLVFSTPYITTRLSSLPSSLQLQCHLSCLSFCCLWSSFSLYTDDEASTRNISKVTRKNTQGSRQGTVAWSYDHSPCYDMVTFTSLCCFVYGCIVLSYYSSWS